MRKSEMIGKLFGIALVFAMIWSMLPLGSLVSQSQALAQDTRSWYVDDLVDYPDGDFTEIQDAV